MFLFYYYLSLFFKLFLKLGQHQLLRYEISLNRCCSEIDIDIDIVKIVGVYFRSITSTYFYLRRNNLNNTQSDILSSFPAVKTERTSFNDRTSFATVIQLKDGLSRKRSGSSKGRNSWKEKRQPSFLQQRILRINQECCN